MLTNTQKSPLTYPNDRPGLGARLRRYIPAGTKQVTTPFLTGGSLELSLANKGYSVTGCTDFRLLYDFWDCLRRDPERVYQMVQQFYPIESDRLFYMLQKKIYQPNDEFLRSALFYVLNLCSKEGNVLSGKIEPGTPRYTELKLMQLLKYDCQNFRVNLRDYEEAIEKAEGFIICTPPKFISTMLNGAVLVPDDRQIDHKKLAAALDGKNNWILLYNYHRKLLKMYDGNKFVFFDENMRHTPTPDKAAEVLILGP